MIKHIAICDKCKKEVNLEVFGGGDIVPVYKLPQHWEEHGVCPKYTLCGECSSILKCLIQDEIYKFTNWDKKDGG